MRRGSFGGVTGSKVLACLLPRVKAIVAGWR
jgi:hypothetical protein